VSPGLRRLTSIAALAAVGCSASISTGAPAATDTLRPYASPTGTSTLTPVPEASAPQETPRPTSTPFTHIVQKDETLLFIAAEYGISLDTLLAANPGINPRLLGIGQQLTIPGPEGGPLIPELPTTTPIPVQVSDASCYPSLTGGLTCLASVSNPGDEAIEGVVVRFSLSPRDGGTPVSVDSYTPLNLLLPGQALPVSASFSIPSDGFPGVLTKVLSALPAAQTTNRYADVSLDETSTQSSGDKTSWTLAGEARINVPEGAEVRRLAILAMGFDASGRIVGFAEAEPDNPSDASVPFELRLFSLGPPIARVQVVAEASVSD
jgi:LysM repeat protein